MIIKILQDEIKSTSSSSVSQYNLLNCAECISNKEIYSSSGKDSAWKEIQQNKHFEIQPKKPLSNLSQQNSYIQFSKNRFESLSNYKSRDPPSNHVHTKSKQKQPSRNSVQNKYRIVLIVDIQVRGCSYRLSNILGSSCNTFGVTKPNANLKAITDSINLSNENLTNDDVVIVVVQGM